MKRLIVLILILTLMFTGCDTVAGKIGILDFEKQSTVTDTDVIDTTVNPENDPEGNNPEGNNPEGNNPEPTHKYVPSVTAPTCSAMGYTTYTCSECGDSYVSDVLSALGHKYDAVVTEPSDDKNGYTTYTCATCGDYYVVEDTAHAHSYSATVTAPTCVLGGYTTYTCSTCGDSYVANEVGALGHSYKSAVTAPTCVSGGYTLYTCTICSDSYTGNTVAATGHSYKSTVTAPTCTAAGYTTYTCSACSDSYTGNEVAATGHSYSSVVTAPTCTEAGYTTYTCSLCSNSYTGNAVSATGHTNKTVKGYAATCTVSGLSDGVVCSVCNVTVTAQTSIAPLGHSWVDATTSAPKTCTTCGATEGDKLPSVTGYSDTLYIDYIDVGQGDSILIRVADCDILIDAGTASYGTTVSNYLKNKGVDDIELMINTHPDSDHCGGLTKVLNTFVVEEVWISKDTSKDTAAYKNFISAVGTEGLTAKQPSAGAVFTYEYLTITVLYSQKGSDSNNSSIVIMLEYGSFKFLFTGDAGEEVEKKLLNSGADLSCDVLKVGHHGSKYSSTAAFLSATGADYGVICVGAGNSYGHPTSEALTRLSNAGITVFRTDLAGDITFSTNGATLTLPGGSSVSGGSSSGSSSSGSSSSGSSSSGSSSSGSSSNSTQYFIGNTETKVFHLPTCSNLPAASKQNTMYDYWWIINIAGYTPCGRCLKGYSTTTTGYIANKDSRVYHLSTCSYLPASSKQIVIYNTTGYTPCGHCLKGSSTVSYIANTETKVYHLPTCSHLPASSKQKVIYDTTGYTPCGHCID